MVKSEKEIITVSAEVKALVDQVWNLWTGPQHIVRWNNASDDWHTVYAENDLQAGGKFISRMEAKDGTNGFDFNGVYLKIEHLKYIEYNIEGGREVKVSFVSKGNVTIVTESFEAEQTYPIEMQKTGWQAILNNFKKYVEKSPEIHPGQ